MNIDDVQKKLADLYDKASTVYKEEAKAQIDYEDIEKEKDIRFAVYEIGYDDGKMAKNKLESKVYADPKWSEYVTEKHLGKAEYLKKKANVKAFEAKLEILRSLNKQFQVL